MSAFAGFWIGLGLFGLGICIDNGLCELAKVFRAESEEWRKTIRRMPRG